ncbi:MAG: SPFH domain-containing protein [Oscillospiraceae bacterium]|nr:SPFH domain-containing protein [Oscillospiraceae bacterium]
MAETKNKTYQETELCPKSGWGMLAVSLLLYVLAFVLLIAGGIMLDGGRGIGAALFVPGILWVCLGWILFLGLKTVRPNEALVLTLFGRYIGTVKQEGFYYVNPFCSVMYPGKGEVPAAAVTATADGEVKASATPTVRKTVSLKAQAFDNNKQKINDELGNPIEVGIVVAWQVVDTAKAVFNVDNYPHYVQLQADSALRDVVRLYPYDSFEGREISLRSDAAVVSERIEAELQKRVEIAGIRILDARITHLAYAPEIAPVMLQRQQAEAVIEARQKIVEGAVGMVEMALNRLGEKDICTLDDERRAQMVSNLLVVLCGDKGAQPVVNSGSIY